MTNFEATLTTLAKASVSFVFAACGQSSEGKFALPARAESANGPLTMPETKYLGELPAFLNESNQIFLAKQKFFLFLLALTVAEFSTLVYNH